MTAFVAALPVPPGDSVVSSSVFLPRYENGSSRLAVSKPSWIVRTESNVRREKMKRPDPPCVVCDGSGRIDCHYCRGRGRTNCLDLIMLPKGEWPKWCKVCGGSGLGHCNRCLGTGEYRDGKQMRVVQIHPRDNFSRKVLNVKASNRVPNAMLYVRRAEKNLAGMARRNCCSLYDELTRDSNKNRDVPANCNPNTYVYDKALNMGESRSFGSSVWEKEELKAKTTAAIALVLVFAIPTS